MTRRPVIPQEPNPGRMSLRRAGEFIWGKDEYRRPDEVFLREALAREKALGRFIVTPSTSRGGKHRSSRWRR